MVVGQPLVLPAVGVGVGVRVAVGVGVGLGRGRGCVSAWMWSGARACRRARDFFGASRPRGVEAVAVQGQEGLCV